MHICVLGAGVIGVTTAHSLLQDGHEVSLLDSQPEAAQMTSYGNGAQLSYSYVAPLADPSVWSKWPHYLFSKNSPLTLRPKLDIDQWRWLLQFLGASNGGQVKKTTIDLLQLAFLSRDSLAALLAHQPIDFSHNVAGKLVMFSDRATLDAARSQIAFQAEYGCHQQVLDARQCMEIEPALAASNRQWTGGVWTPSEAAGDCPAFCAGLLRHMQQSPKFRFLPHRRVSGAIMEEADGRRLRAVICGEQHVSADAYVLALGAESTAFARRLGFRLPLYPLKGYSITVPVQSTEAVAAPRVSITDAARKIVYARLGDRLRVAGRVEIVGSDRSIPQRAVRELVEGTRELFPQAGDLSDAAKLTPWAGFRPATPTGLPIIGRSPFANLYLNVGHGALGWTLACGSAALLAQQIAGQATAIDATPYAWA